MKTIRNLALFAVLGFLILGCSRGDEGENVSGRVAVSFSTSIDDGSRTTDGGDKWELGDPVRICMLTAGGQLTQSQDVLVEHAKYRVTDPTTGALAPDNGIPIYYPESGDVDFIAYHTSDDRVLPVEPFTANVKNQTTQEEQNKLDILYAKASGASKSTDAVRLTFRHVMSRLTLDVKAGTGFASDDIANLNGSSVLIKNMPAQMRFNLQDGSSGILPDSPGGSFNPLKAAVAADGFEASFTAILIPNFGQGGRTVTFTIGGQQYTWQIPSDHDFLSGVHYTYPLTVNKTGITLGDHSIADWIVNRRE